MANQTITVDSNWTANDAGLNDGQNITINNGAVLTFDQSPTKLIGQITINDGEMLIDGANATNPIIFVGEELEEINVNGAGKIRTTLGWWEFPTTSDGTANQTFDCSTYFNGGVIDKDVFSGVWVETGRRINYDNGTGVLPKVGDWLYKSNDWEYVHGRIVEVSGTIASGYIVVQFFTGALVDSDDIQVHSLQDRNGPNLEKSWNAQCVGADVLEPDVWQGFGNAYQNSIDGLPSLGSGMAGFAFSQAWLSNTLTFGDGTNGFIPPNGARIRVPMIHFASSDLTAITTNDPSFVTSYLSRYNIETVNGGVIELKGVSIGSAWFEDTLAGGWTSEYVSANGGHGGWGGTLSRTSYKNCIFTSCHVFGARSGSRSVPAIVDLPEGADIEDCIGVYTNDSAETTQFGGQTSIEVSIKRCIQVVNNNTTIEFEALRITDLTVDDFVIIGTQFVINACIGVDIKNLKTQANVLGGTGDAPAYDQVSFAGGTDGARLTGWEMLQNSAPDDSKVIITDCSNIEVRCFHYIDDKFDNESGGIAQGEEFTSISGFCNNITFARCWTDRGAPNEFALIASGTVKGVTVINCSAEYNGEVEPDGINTQFRGLHSGSGTLGSTNGLETDLVGTAGSNCHDIFESNTRGYFSVSMCPGSSLRPIEIVSGNPKFTKDGDVDMVNGDSFIIEMDYFAKGHTSFRNVAPTFGRQTASAADGTDQWGANIDCEFQYDTGSGYNGTWLDMRVNANRTAITNMVDGIKFKYRITATGTQTDIQAFVFYTDTTLQDQLDNLHPIDQLEVNLNLTGLKPNTEIRIFEAGTTNEVAGQEDINSGSYQYTYSYIVDQDVDISIISLGYLNSRLKNVTLSSDNQTIPISQQLDRQYLNV